MTQIFVQAAPALGNQYRDDDFLRSYLQRKVPAPALGAIVRSAGAAILRCR